MKTAAVDPRRFTAFIRAVIGPIARARPNSAHLAIAAAEKHCRLKVVTQNIDGLHQDAGSTLVHEIHGTILEVVTQPGGHTTSLKRETLLEIDSVLENLSQSGLGLAQVMKALQKLFGVGLDGARRPNLILFGDQLAEPAWSLAQEAARSSDCLVQIGCSRVVWPASTLPELARSAGAKTIAIDPSESDGDIWLKGKAAAITPDLFNMAFERGFGDSTA